MELCVRVQVRLQDEQMGFLLITGLLSWALHIKKPYTPLFTCTHTLHFKAILMANICLLYTYYLCWQKSLSCQSPIYPYHQMSET